MPIGPPVYHSTYWGSDYLWFAGGWVTPVTRSILLAAASASGWGTIRLAQGGFSHATASANTHGGLDVVDIAIDGRSKAKVWALCAALKRSGMLPFPRGYVADTFQNNKHIHAVRNPASHAHPEAKAQLREYQTSHGDGLVGSRSYTGPSTALDTWDHSPYNPRNVKTFARRTYWVNVSRGSFLYGLSVDRKDKNLHRKRGFKLAASKMVYRWGRWNVVTSYGTYYALSELSTKKVS